MYLCIFSKNSCFFKLDKKNNKFSVFGLSSNVIMSLYRFLLLYNKAPSLIIVDNRNIFFIKILEIFFALFFSIVIVSLYLKNKNVNIFGKK